MTAPRLRVTDEDGETWDDPSEQQIDRLYAGLNLRRRFLILDRLDVPEAESEQHYLQAALNDDLTVVLEYREGSGDRHYRAEVDEPSDQGGAEIVMPVLLGWANGRPGWRDSLTWVRWDATRERPWN
ncbi:hypothetical protein [Streptomyces olivochromogenes]|uniref:hypothetical protein n=1 Tax=Streptomyces olivochromogenes TaxID=1963 RepID=UPI001F33C9C4|nr:hypothetical protein [Streptomyces olivochromogenes]MCF3133284.1 hypothetical protein [Streptomyces olivochromogenes]